MEKVISLAAFLFALVAKADYQLYWEYNPSESGGDVVEFTYARILVSGDTLADPTYLTLENGEIAGFLAKGAYSSASHTGTTIAPNYVNIDDYASSAYSFAVELYTLENEGAKTSDFVTFADLVAFGSIYENMVTTGIRPYNFAVRAIPEPTGGLLVLLGLGALALRRKKVEA